MSERFNPYIAWPLRALLVPIFAPFLIGAFILYFLPWFVFRILLTWAAENAFCGRVTISQVMKEAGY